MINEKKYNKHANEMEKDVYSVAMVHIERLRNDDEIDGSEFAAIIMSVFSSLTIEFYHWFKTDKDGFLETLEICYDKHVEQLEREDD
jgi:hypothetical protein